MKKSIIFAGGMAVGVGLLPSLVVYNRKAQGLLVTGLTKVLTDAIIKDPEMRNQFETHSVKLLNVIHDLNQKDGK